MSQAAGEHESQSAGLGFFVVVHQLQQPAVVQVRRQPDRQAQLFQQSGLAQAERLVHASEPPGQQRRAVHAHGHRFAVEPPGILARGFQGVGERVAVVEHGPMARGFPLVGGHHLGFQLATAGDDLPEHVRFASLDGRYVLFQVGEERFVQNHAVLDHFGQPGPVLVFRQRVQHGGVNQHGQRLPEGSDDVFRSRQVDAHFAPDGTVHLGQQRGGHLDESQPPGESGRHESGQIAGDAAAQGHDHRPAIHAQLEHLLPKLLGLADRFALLARRDNQPVHPRGPGAEAPLHRLGVESGHVRVGH